MLIMTTSEQQPPAYNDHRYDRILTYAASEQQQPAGIFVFQGGRFRQVWLYK